MEEKLAKLKEYLAMDTEISFEEFTEYYKSVIALLNQEYEQMSREDRIRAKYICTIVGNNAEARGRESKKQAKPFRKMAEKCNFWRNAIDHRLRKEGVSEEEIEKQTEEFSADT